MTSLKQLAMYCRDYIDLVSPSLMSRQAKQALLPKDILDATPLYNASSEVDYENLVLPLELTLSLEEIEAEDAVADDQENEDTDSSQEDENRKKLEIARVLDDIYRKYETSSYTKQVTLKFGRVSLSAIPINDNEDDEEAGDEKYRKIEQHLFSVPVSISFRDSGGQRHYSLLVEDTQITTNVSFLNNYLAQEQRDELFKFVSQSEASEQTAIPLNPAYVDELWTKISWFLREAEAKDVSSAPDMDNTIVILLPKVNYFLSQDLLGIIDTADDEELLETSLSAWVDDRDMSVSEDSDDSGKNELFFPFPYDNSQLQVLGKLGNRAAVVEGPPGTGKSQTIANILCHLAASGKKVLFVSQKDQAVRGVKDKLKTLDIPYLYGYLPDRSSKLHSEEDERDSAANALKGIAQAYFQSEGSPNPNESLVNVHESKPVFDNTLNKQREYFKLYNKWLELDKYDFAENSPRLTPEWYMDLVKHRHAVKEAQVAILESERETEKLKLSLESNKAKLERATKATDELAPKLKAITNYTWIDDEKVLMRGLEYSDIAEAIGVIIESFEENVVDRKSNFIKSAVDKHKLSKIVDGNTQNLPRELYETIRGIIFQDQTRNERYKQLERIKNYFELKERSLAIEDELQDKLVELEDLVDQSEKSLKNAKDSLRRHMDAIERSNLDETSMARVETLYEKESDKAFDLIKERYELGQQLDDFKTLNPNEVSELIKAEKHQYTNLIRTYLRNRLASQVETRRTVKQYRAALESIGRKLGKTKKAYKTFDTLKSDPFNFEAMSSIIPIWMMGLDDASRVLPLERNIFDYVIIDEASQCNISYALPAMYRSQHTILFGDTLQMRDTTTAFKSNERLQAIADKHSIPEDLQIKAMEDSVKSVMDIAKLSGFQTSVLRNHYRSPIELIGFSNEYFYAPRGRRLQVVNDDIVATDEGRVLTNHIITPDLNVELSEKTNLSEAYYIKNNLLPAIRSNPSTSDKSIAILTFFNEQAELLRRVITDDDIKIAVIEGIQGDERDIVIYSFVIKSPKDKPRYIALTGESGEIRKEVNEGRVNVAFSRARLQVHTVTSLAPNLWPEGIWIKKYLEYVEQKGRVNRLSKSEQHFDSKFEENVYDYLLNHLDHDKYTLTTQVESCGFKIDLVVRNIKTGKKLALECDGPTHFEMGDGQVRVASDFERQYVLETAGWRFYHIIFSEWQKDEATAKKELADYINDYMKSKKETVDITQTPVNTEYKSEAVVIPQEFVESVKAAAASAKPNAFGRRNTVDIVSSKQPTASSQTQIFDEPRYVPLDEPKAVPKPEVKPAKKPTPKKTSEKPKTSSDFRTLNEIELSPKRSVVISQKPDGTLWVNEKLHTDTYTGFTFKGFGIDPSDLDVFITSLSDALTSKEYEKEFIISDSLKLVIHTPDLDTVDIRYFKTSSGYTGYLKKGIRVMKASGEKIRDGLISAKSKL
jgi:superfamily I DNA and/or RNA helicase